MKRIFILSALAGLLAIGLSAQPTFEDTPADKQAKKDAAQTAQASDAAPYGFQLGTISGFVNFAPAHITDLNGLHLGAEGGAEFGVHKYIGIFTQAGWTGLGASASSCYGVYCANAKVRADYADVGGGVEVIGTNHTRFVPYGKFGVGYMLARASASAAVPGYVYYGASDSVNSPTLIYGGGLKVYVNHHFGVSGGFTSYTSLGSVHGTAIAPTVGVFFQSK